LEFLPYVVNDFHIDPWFGAFKKNALHEVNLNGSQINRLSAIEHTSALFFCAAPNRLRINKIRELLD
jgi:hypothetical protein